MGDFAEYVVSIYQVKPANAEITHPPIFVLKPKENQEADTDDDFVLLISSPG